MRDHITREAILEMTVMRRRILDTYLTILQADAELCEILAATAFAQLMDPEARFPLL